jgi:hypothetical protein
VTGHPKQMIVLGFIRSDTETRIGSGSKRPSGLRGRKSPSDPGHSASGPQSDIVWYKPNCRLKSAKDQSDKSARIPFRLRFAPHGNTGAALLEGDFYFHIGSRRAGIHSGGYFIEMQPHQRALLVSENDERNFPACRFC